MGNMHIWMQGPVRIAVPPSLIWTDDCTETDTVIRSTLWYVRSQP